MMTSSTERSDLWEFFQKTSSKTGACGLFSKQLACHGGMGNLPTAKVNVFKFHWSEPTEGWNVESWRSSHLLLESCQKLGSKCIDGY